MADITKRTSPEPGVDAQSAMRCRFIPELQAGVSLAKGDACYIDSNSRVQKAVSTQVGITGSSQAWVKFDGMVAEDFVSGSFGVTLYGRDAIFGYASGLTVGSFLWVSSTAGKLQDAMPSAFDMPVAQCISATDIQLIR